jgi:hypothetical protein
MCGIRWIDDRRKSHVDDGPTGRVCNGPSTTLRRDPGPLSLRVDRGLRIIWYPDDSTFRKAVAPGLARLRSVNRATKSGRPSNRTLKRTTSRGGSAQGVVGTATEAGRAVPDICVSWPL